MYLIIDDDKNIDYLVAVEEWLCVAVHGGVVHLQLGPHPAHHEPLPEGEEVAEEQDQQHVAIGRVHSEDIFHHLMSGCVGHDEVE